MIGAKASVIKYSLDGSYARFVIWESDNGKRRVIICFNIKTQTYADTILEENSGSSAMGDVTWKPVPHTEWTHKTALSDCIQELMMAHLSSLPYMPKEWPPKPPPEPNPNARAEVDTSPELVKAIKALKDRISKGDHLQ